MFAATDEPGQQQRDSSNWSRILYWSLLAEGSIEATSRLVKGLTISDVKANFMQRGAYIFNKYIW